MADKETINVEVKSAWLSKINWTQGIALAATVLSVFGLDLDPHTQVAVVSTITGIATVVTWFLRTFRTKTVTPSAEKNIS